MILLEAVLMFGSTAVAAFYDSGDVITLLVSGGITFGTGVVCSILSKPKDVVIDRKLGYIVVALIWLTISFFGSLPFIIGGYIPSITDAWFETVSGFTTTGATILDNVELLPKGIMFWRCLTQWVGGIGIVVVVVAFMQIEGGGGMSLISAEMVGPEKGKITPSTRQTGRILVVIYYVLTLTCGLAYWLGGMSLYDAVCHSFATVSSGGFSTKDASAAAFGINIQYLMMLFMIPAGANFILIYNLFKGKFSWVKRNEEFKLYIFLIFAISLIVSVLNYTADKGVELTLREGFFQVISVISTTGFTTANYGLWGTLAIFFICIMMVTGSMSGSTSGGIKLVRVIVLVKNVRNIIKMNFHNRALIPVKLDGRNVPSSVLYNVLAVFLLYIAVFIVATLLLTLAGLNFTEALEGCLSCLGCVGTICIDTAHHTFSAFPDAAKWIFSILMYLGRLEIVTVIIIFLPSFWKR
jgi:trk system potassium uptake protein TrkH